MLEAENMPIDYGAISEFLKKAKKEEKEWMKIYNNQ